MKKRYKKFIKYFISVSIIAMSILPVYNFYQYAKQYDKSKIFNIDAIQKYINYKLYKFCNRSLEQGSVIAGKNNFLFLGNQYDNVLHKTNGIYKPSLKEIDTWTNKLKDLQNWYESKEIKFLLVIAPNKHSVYKENLPNWMQYNGDTLTDNIVKQSLSKNINFLDLRNSLINAKNHDGLLYFKSDTHWNNYGSSIGYSSTIDYLNDIYNLNIQKPQYTILDDFRGSGDLANFLKISSLLKKDYENGYKYIFNEKYEVCHGNINIGDGSLEKCNNKLNPTMGINAQPQYMINNQSKNNYSLLLLCDSFGTANSELYNASFKTIWKWHYGHINGVKLANFINQNKPDVVIYQIVERALYNDTIVAKPF